VDCFGYIQLGRHFGKDYQTNLLILSMVRLRLSRWGEAVNIHGDPQLGNPKATREDVQLAKNTLLQILVLFADTEKVSKKFKLTAKSGDLTSYTAADMEPAILGLNNKMRDLAIKRQKGASLLKLTSWAVYDGAEFNKLIDSITKLVDGLEALFPAPTAEEKRLVDEEVDAVKDEQDLKILERAAGNTDTLFRMTAAAARTGHFYTNTEATENAKMFNGNSYGKDWVANKGAQSATCLMVLKHREVRWFRMGIDMERRVFSTHIELDFR
jgi:hypothetical protein